MNTSLKTLLFLTHFLTILGIYRAADTIDTAQSISDGQTIVSSGEMFELGFFSPDNSTNRYMGIWYKNISAVSKTVVWVANREVPILNKSGILKVTEHGILVLLNGANGTTVWSSNASSTPRNPVARLLDSGNLVVRDGVDYLWESFDHPTDTYLPGMKFGRNFVTGLDKYLTSWKSDEDPASGDYIYTMDTTGYPQIYLKNKGIVQIRLGPWNGLRFRWRRYGPDDPTIKWGMVMNEEEIAYMGEPTDNAVITRYIISSRGLLEYLVWDGQANEWRTYLTTKNDDCDQYRLCGAYGLCTIETSPVCGCLDKFVPKNPESWARADWSRGCMPRTNLSCEGDGFLRYSGLKMPEARNTLHKEGLSLEECKAECLRNCSCMAYSQLDVRMRSGCIFWHEELTDMRYLGDQIQDIYVRIAATELEAEGKRNRVLVGSLASVVGMVILVMCLCLYIRKRKHNSKASKGTCDGHNQQDPELPFLGYSVVVKATNNFSVKNKLGEGGFGPVFKGILKDEQEIAVKCPSSTSIQGINEFKNEAIFIAKLQHRNLVRLLGCCIHGDKNMLIYEYMCHGSLDGVLFDADQRQSVLLDWPKRFNIINGIARGLLYLHEDSRLRIIHRDLKASNVLLDSNFNPKISDFGTARSFRGNGSTTKTHRIVGTYGYMSPEYAIDGLFSIKSDVFSFGVLVLEIVSGQKNRGFSHKDHHLNLLGHAWTLYKEGRSLELVDTSLISCGFDIAQMLRCIHVGLLCVQKRLEDRPTMSSVILMLGNEGALPNVNQPGYYTERDTLNDQSWEVSGDSTNEITITILEGR